MAAGEDTQLNSAHVNVANVLDIAVILNMSLI
jgi:hypothetical protein